MNVKPRHFRRVCECVRYPGFVAAPLVLIGLLSVAPASASSRPHTRSQSRPSRAAGPGLSWDILRQFHGRRDVPEVQPEDRAGHESEWGQGPGPSSKWGSRKLP